MTVVVGGVGTIWGTLAEAMMIGSLQKGIEWSNPSNALAALEMDLIRGHAGYRSLATWRSSPLVAR